MGRLSRGAPFSFLSSPANIARNAGDVRGEERFAAGERNGPVDHFERRTRRARARRRVGTQVFDPVTVSKVPLKISPWAGWLSFSYERSELEKLALCEG